MPIQNSSKTAMPLFVWGIADVYFILAVTIIILFGILLPSLETQLGLNSTQLGLLGFACFLSYGAMQFLTGSLIDSVGPRVTLTGSALTAAAGLFLLSHASSFAWAMVAQLILGMGLSISYVGAVCLARMWFSERQFPIMSGITQMSANIVSSVVLFSMALVGTISTDFRTLAMRLGWVALFLAVLLCLIVRKAPSENQVLDRSVGAELSQLLRIPQFWFGVLYFSTNFGAFLAFSSLWNIPDSLAYGHSLETATMMSATLRFGGAFGAVLSGVLVHGIGRCSTVVKWYSTGSLCLAAFLIYGPVFPDPLTFAIMGFLGFFCGGTALGFPLVAQHIPPALKGTGFGLMTSLGYLLCALLQYLTGSFLNHMQAATVGGFKIALTPLVVVLGIGWIFALRLKSQE